MLKSDPSGGLSTAKIERDFLKTQNISLANKITTLKRENAELSYSKNEFESKSLALETNFSFFKLNWIKHLNDLKATRQLQKPFNDKKLEQEFEECFRIALGVFDTLTFQQSQDGFQESLSQIFKAMGKVYKDIVTDSLHIIEAAVERATLEIKQTEASTKEGLSNLSSYQQKLQELSDSLDMIRDTKLKIDENNFLTQQSELKKKVMRLEEELKDLKEYNEVLGRRCKINLKEFVQIDEDIGNEKKLGCICGGKIFDCMIIKDIKVPKGTDKDEEEKIIEVEEKDNELSLKEKSYDIITNDVSVKGEEIKLLKLEQKRLKRMLTCPVCELQEKSVVLLK